MLQLQGCCRNWILLGTGSGHSRLGGGHNKINKKSHRGYLVLQIIVREEGGGRLGEKQPLFQGNFLLEAR